MTGQKTAATPPSVNPAWREVRRFLRDAVRNNLNLKIIAAALAVVAWLLVQGRPTAEEYATIRLDYSWPEELVLEGKPVDRVLVKAVGPRANLREMTHRDLRYRIDLSDAAAGETTLNLTGMLVEELPSNLSITTISPASLSFRFDERLTKAVQVSVPTRGEPAFGFEILEIVVEPNVVALSGAAPDLESLEEVRTRPLDLSGRDRNFAEILSLDLGSLRARPDQDAEVSVYVRLAQVIEEREMEVVVTLPEELEGVTVEPAHATVTLHGPARELHRVMAASIHVYLDDPEVSFRDGKARVEYAPMGKGEGQPRVRVQAEGLPDAVEVRSLEPSSFALVRSGN